MPTTTNTITSAVLSPDTASLYIQDKLLERANVDLVFAQFGEKASIPTGEGKTTAFIRYERLPLPTGPLEEGVTPPITPIKLSTVQAVLDQWGAYVAMTDVSQLTVKHPIFTIARGLLEDQHNELVDREIQVPLMASSAITYANAKTTRVGLVTADTIVAGSALTTRKVVAQLRSFGARPYSDGKYRGVCDPFVEMDLMTDTTFVTASSYSNIRTLQNAEIGDWMGIRWSRCNFIPILKYEALTTGGGVTGSSVAANSGITAGMTGWTAGGTAYWKVTRVDPITGFETAIGPQTTTTITATQCLNIALTTCPVGVYKIYVAPYGGATGTALFQVRVNHIATTATDNVAFGQSGTPTAVGGYILMGTGPVAPPDIHATLIPGGVHTSYIMGQGHFGVTNMNEGLRAYLTASGAEKSDPLDQRRTAGWKRMMKALMLNPNFGRRIESGSAHD